MNVEGSAQEENPAMGWRALRLALEREGLLKVQARALMEAAAGRTLNVMFPMVSEPWEYEAARGLFVGQRAWLASHNKKLPVAIRYGAMLEVPDRKSTRLNSVTNAHLVFRSLLAKKKPQQYKNTCNR